ncbi:MAG TPA: fatty acid desaturase [Myxococcaceae bacterium]|jgi:fatty acid desaturase
MSTFPHLVDDLEQALDAPAGPGLSRRSVPRELLVPARVPELLRMALEEWAAMVLLWLAMAWTPRWLYPLWALLVATRLHALGVVLHEVSHLPLRRHGPGVRTLEVLAGYPIAITVAAMRYHHIRHHRDSGMATDPYFKGSVSGRPVKYALNVLRGALLIPFWSVRPAVGLASSFLRGWRTFYGRVFLQDRSGEDLRESREVIACGRAEVWQLAFQLALVPAWVAFPSAMLRGYLVPAIAAGLLAAWRLLLDHPDRPACDRSLETIVATTRDNIQGWLRLLLPRNIGYHVVHHLHPQVTLTALPRLRDWYVANCERYPR